MLRCYSSFVCGSIALLFASVAVLAASARPASSPTEVAYLLVGSTIQTYNVDRATGNPTEEGSGVMIDSVSNTVVLPSSDDHFLYVTGNDSGGIEWLWVYATDSTGVPQLPAVQALNLTDGSFNTYDFVISPNGTQAYAAESMYNSNYFLIAKVAGFTINPTTGIVTKTGTAWSYKQNGPCLLTAEAFFQIYGFSPAGNVLYDDWDCNYPYANNSGNYYRRYVNSSTGALGPDNLIFIWGDGNEGQDVVNITPANLVYFSIPNNTSYGGASVNFYTTGGKSEFSCTASMLEACGYGLWNFLDPAGRFDLIEIAPDLTEITKIETASKQLVSTNNYIQGQFLAFSPDEALIYTQQYDQSNPWLYPIYVFNPSTGAVSYAGGAIWDNTAGGTLITASRR